MTEIKLLYLDKYKNADEFEKIEDGIYKNLIDGDETNYRIALSYKVEEGEDQYPLEDILDEYLLYVSDFLDSDPAKLDQVGRVVNMELAGELEDIRKAALLVGKRVYNNEFTEDDGEVYVKLVIE
jgi:hypothetical protein